MINPYYFTDRVLKIGFKINLDSHHINYANSNRKITPHFPEFGLKFVILNKSLENYLLYMLH